MYPQQPNSAPPNPNAYDFIVNPSAAPKRSLVAGTSPLTRLLIMGAGLVILLILFIVVKNLLTSDGGYTGALIKVASQQQEVITVTAAATTGSQPLSDSSRAIAITTQVSLGSAQSQLLAYLKTSGHNVTKKQLLYPGRLAITNQLAAANAAGTYDVTLQQVLKSQLIDYQTSLKQAYNKTKVARGRELLQKDYADATLLLHQFGTTP